MKNTLKSWENFLENNYILILLISFTCFVLIKSSISLFFPSPFNFGDEAVYELQARSFFYNNFPFQSGFPIGYPLILSIAYHLSSDKLIIYHSMLIINSLLVTSIIFPLFFILRKYCSNLYSLSGAIVVSCLPSVNVYSFMLLSENLFIPLFYFALWFLLESIDQDGKIWQILAGFSIVSLFFIRTTGIAMVLSLFLLFFVLSMIEIKNRSFYQFFSKKIYLWFSGFITLLLGLFFNYSNNLNLTPYNTENYFSLFLSNFSSIQGLKTIGITFLNELQYIIISLYFLIILIIGIFLIISIPPKIAVVKETGRKKIDEISHSLFSLRIILMFFSFVFFFTIIITITHMLGIETIYNFSSNYSILGRYLDPIIPGIFLFGFLGLEQIFTKKEINYSKSTISLIILAIIVICISAISRPFDNYNPSNIFPILYIEKILSNIPYIVFVLIALVISSCISLIVIIKEKKYLLHVFIILCIFLSSFYAINIELSQSNHAGQFSDIGHYFDKSEEKNFHILYDVGDSSSLDQIHYYLTQFWCQYPLIKFSAHDEISGEFKNRVKSGDYLISTQSLDLPLLISSGSGYKLYQISPDPGQNHSILLINRLEGNWYGLERDDNGEFFRWMFNDAIIWIYSDAERDSTLSFEAQSLKDDWYLVVSDPKSRAHQTYNLSMQVSDIHYKLHLNKGENSIILLSSSKTNNDLAFTGSKNITVAVRQVRIE